MRGRKKEPGGRRVTISIKVSEAEAEVISIACGSRSRSGWGREALLAAARHPAAPPARALRAKAPGAVPFRAPAATARHALTCKCAICKPGTGKEN
jgi:hypothetical protein